MKTVHITGKVVTTIATAMLPWRHLYCMMLIEVLGNINWRNRGGSSQSTFMMIWLTATWMTSPWVMQQPWTINWWKGLFVSCQNLIATLQKYTILMEYGIIKPVQKLWKQINNNGKQKMSHYVELMSSHTCSKIWEWTSWYNWNKGCLSNKMVTYMSIHLKLISYGNAINNSITQARKVNFNPQLAFLWKLVVEKIKNALKTIINVLISSGV